MSVGNIINSIVNSTKLLNFSVKQIGEEVTLYLANNTKLTLGSFMRFSSLDDTHVEMANITTIPAVLSVTRFREHLRAGGEYRTFQEPQLKAPPDHDVERIRTCFERCPSTGRRRGRA